jgi:DNA-directed RNA polymerase subunit RPC12/RpoP
MSLHLFSTPVQCTQCGTTVEDPSVERCPNCGSRLKERRAPRRLAGVEQRYGSLRVLLGIMRFLGVIVFAIGALIFVSSLGTSRSSASQTGGLFVGSILIAVVFLAAAGLFELLIDVEENTRSSFKLQQMILEELAEGRTPAAEPVPAPAAVAAPPVVAPAADGPLAPAVA